MDPNTNLLDSQTQWLASLFEEAKATLRLFSTTSALDAAAGVAFGSTGGAVRSAIQSFDYGSWPQVVLVDAQILHGARGAYDRTAETIYIARELLGEDAAVVTGVLIEELGHAIDARVNTADANGDEGAIFSRYVLGDVPSDAELAALQSESDHGTIVVGEQSVAVEFAGEVVGSITLDGNLSDWAASAQIDSSLSTAGYDLYATSSGGSYVFAIRAPSPVGANTTAWLNTDLNSSTGHLIWGFAGGAEYNINFDSAGVPRLYTGAAGQTLASGATVSYGYSADRTTVEFSIASSAIGSPGALHTLWDINDITFLPSDYSAAQYRVVGAASPAPVVGPITLDGNLSDWVAQDQIDETLSAAGYDLYARGVGDSYVFAIRAPVAIGAATTVWIDADRNDTTGYRIWGFAGGAEYNINFDATGTPRLYSGAAGQTAIEGIPVLFAYSTDRTVVEFAVSANAIGAPAAIDTLWDINDAAFLPTDYSATQYQVFNTATLSPVVGSITLDGNLADWTSTDQIDRSLSVSGYDLYARDTTDAYVFAIAAPVAVGANTTLWLNTDLNAATGFQIFGSTGGAEYNINFDQFGRPHLYTGDAGQTLVPGVSISHAYSADRSVVEFALQKSAIGNAGVVNTLWDVNNVTFLPTNFSATQYQVGNAPPPPQEPADTRVGIVYSQTTAGQYFGQMAYSQLFMAAQNQAAMAGVPFDVLSEADLTDLTKLAAYDTLIFPLFSHVQSSQVSAIASTLQAAQEQYQIGFVTSGNFMTNDQNGAALSGDSYARMKTLLGLQLVDGGFPADVTIRSSGTSHPMLEDYAANELIRSYTGAGWLAFAPTTGTDAAVAATQTVAGQTYGSVITTTVNGARNVHFSSEAVMADNNLLWQAVDYAANGTGVTAGLQLSRNKSIVASRVDMDQAMELFEVNPDDGSPGIYDKMLPVVEQWKAAYNYVASYYVDIGDNPREDQVTDWSLSGGYYRQLIALGNELGSHSVSHPHFTDQLSAAQIQYEFGTSKQIIEQQMSQILGRPFTVDGAAVPGAPESLATALQIIQYYDYISGGFSSIGAGYPSAFGYLNPAMAVADKVYLAPNLQFDFSLIEFRGLTPEQAVAEWEAEWNELASHAEVPVFLWPWHDYGAAAWPTNPPEPSPYTVEMFTNFIARAHAEGAEFVTLADLADRISEFEDASLTTTVSGNTVTALVDSTDAGRFALDLDNLGTQKIARVNGWYAYDDDSVFLPRNGGSFSIELGASQDDVTRIVSLPMRAELISLSGDGTRLDFTVSGEGRFFVDLRNSSTQPYVITGARVVGMSGDRLELAFDQLGQHNVSIRPSSGAAVIDGSLSEWTSGDRIDTSLGLSGYAIYGKLVDDAYVFALQAPVSIGAGTTVWLNVDGSTTTGHRIWGFAGGAEYNINFDANGVPQLYTGDAGQALVSGAPVTYAYSADRSAIEFSIASSAIGSPAALGTLWDVNNATFLPTDYSLTQYTIVSAAPPPGSTPVVGGITLDGSLSDWSSAEQVDDSLSVSGYNLYARSANGSYVFAIQAPVAVGPNTTVWLNTDQNAGTGYRIWGFAGGAEYNINFDATGTPRLYTGDAGQNLVNAAVVTHAYSADRSIVEFAVSGAAIGSPTAINTLWDINNQTFLPTDFSATQYAVLSTGPAAPSAPMFGTVTLDGSLADWSAADAIDATLSVAGYDIYAKAVGAHYVFALSAPVAIGANTTVWLNSDQNASTGYQIWGFAGGAEYNINFDATGTPRLYTGAEGQTPVSSAAISFAYSADGRAVEFAVSAEAIGSPAAVSTLWDINNNTFLPTDYSLTQFEVRGPAGNRIVGDGAANTLSGTAGGDVLLGFAGSDTIRGAEGDDAITGGPGNDTLTGGPGRDRFDYDALADALDTITDFTLGAGGDVLDLRDVLTGYTPGTSVLGNYVQASGGASTTISVNADGAGTDFVPLATLQNIATTGSLLNEMLANGNLVVS